jgi:hypothetical protein
VTRAVAAKSGSKGLGSWLALERSPLGVARLKCFPQVDNALKADYSAFTPAATKRPPRGRARRPPPSAIRGVGHRCHGFPLVIGYRRARWGVGRDDRASGDIW